MHSTQSSGKHFYAISESNAHLLPNLLEIVTIFLPDFSSLVEGIFDLLKGKLKAIPLLWQFMQAIIPLILMIVDITHQDDSSTKTTTYADDFTAAGKITQLKKCWDTLCQFGPKFG